MISPANAHVGTSMEGLYSRYTGTEGQLKVTIIRKQVSQRCSRKLSEAVPFNSAHQCEWGQQLIEGWLWAIRKQPHHYPHIILQLKTSTSFQIFLPFTIFSFRKCPDSTDVLSPACIAERVWGFGPAWELPKDPSSSLPVLRKPEHEMQAHNIH